MYNFLFLIVLFILFWTGFLFHYHIFVFLWFMLQCFLFLQKVVFFPVSFFPTSTMSYAYANTFNCFYQSLYQQEAFSRLCMTFCNAKLNNTGDKQSTIYTVNFSCIQFFIYLTAFFKILSTNVRWESMNIFDIFNHCCYHDAYLCFINLSFNNV